MRLSAKAQVVAFASIRSSSRVLLRRCHSHNISQPLRIEPAARALMGNASNVACIVIAITFSFEQPVTFELVLNLRRRSV